MVLLGLVFMLLLPVHDEDASPPTSDLVVLSMVLMVSGHYSCNIVNSCQVRMNMFIVNHLTIQTMGFRVCEMVYSFCSRVCHQFGTRDTRLTTRR
jgi:hypothetical protein